MSTTIPKVHKISKGPFIILLIIILAVSMTTPAQADERTVIVGVNDFKPYAYMDENGEINGFCYDVFNEIAKREGWDVEYKFTTWQENLNMLDSGEIDVIITMGYTEEREEIYDLSNEYIVSDWVQAYVRPDVEINSIYDLDGMNISGSKRGISIAWFDDYASRRGINYQYIEALSTTEAMEKLDQRLVDAVVVPRTVGTASQNEHEMVGAPIESYPIRFYVAAKKNTNIELIESVDNNLAEMKISDDQVYDAISAKWLGNKTKKSIPYQAKVTIAGIFILFIVILIYTYYLSENIRKKTETIKSTSEKYSVIVEKGNDGIIIEQDKKLKFVNPKFIQMIGLSEQNLLGTGFSDHIQEDCKNIQKDRCQQIWKDNGTNDHRYELNLVNNTEAVIPVEISSTKLEYEGQPAIMSVIRDVTEHKQHEKRLLDAKNYAETANLAQNEFIHNISHELRTPLNSTIGFSDMLLSENSGPLNDKQKKYLNNIKISGTHLLTLINEILNISKIETGNIELELSEVDIYSTIEDVKVLMPPLLAEKDNELVVNIQDNIGKFNADRLKLKQILHNILSNAVKFSPENGKIIMDIGVIDKELQISISDTGKGLSEKEKETIFLPFVQADDEHSKEQKGTGLGLAIVKHFVEIHKGNIWVNSKVNEGATFTFTIPLDLQPDNTSDQ